MNIAKPVDAAYERALEQIGALIQGTRADQLTLATPCSDWDVRALINHFISGLGRFAAMASGQRVDFSAPVPDVADRPVAAYRSGLSGLLAAYRDHPEGRARTRSIHLIECAIHAWDLAAATARAAQLDPTVAVAALAAAEENLTTDARAGSTAFGPPVPVAPHAPPCQRLAGLLGRQPVP